mmetsp:Transcript_26444/g.26835  ORF Transcript_26444/g.26835 Transcript_26444/m.26835 type:complete len:108 (+) Transcript_26444:333-656(+)
MLLFTVFAILWDGAGVYTLFPSSSLLHSKKVLTEFKSDFFNSLYQKPKRTHKFRKKIKTINQNPCLGIPQKKVAFLFVTFSMVRYQIIRLTPNTTHTRGLCLDFHRG